MYFDKPLFLEQLKNLKETRKDIADSKLDELIDKINELDICTQSEIAVLIDDIYRNNKLSVRAKSRNQVKLLFHTISKENRTRLKALPKKSKLIYQCVVGSQAFKTQSETSDYDLKGVYIQDTFDFGLHNGYIPSVTIGKDEIYFELRRFIELLVQGEAIAMEMLFSPKRCITIQTPEFKYLRHHRDIFIVKRLYYTFYNYAIQQFKKATNYNKMANWDESRTTRRPISDFCTFFDRYTGQTNSFKNFLESEEINPEDITLTKLDGMVNNYKVYHYKTRGWYSDTSNEVRTGAIPKEKIHDWLGVISFNHSEYSTHCKEFAKYQKWLVDRSDERYNTNIEHGQKFDAKNIMHTVRLIMVSKDILEKRTIVVERENEREYLLDIKNGRLPLKEVLDEWLDTSKDLEEKFMNSDMEMSPDEKIVSDIIYNIRLFQKTNKKEVLLKYI